MLIIKSRKPQMTKRIELPNQEKIRTFREKEIYKYLGVLEADTMKHAEMKEKIKEEYFKERENYTKPKYIAENSSKG